MNDFNNSLKALKLIQTRKSSSLKEIKNADSVEMTCRILRTVSQLCDEAISDLSMYKHVFDVLKTEETQIPATAEYKILVKAFIEELEKRIASVKRKEGLSK